MKNSLRHFVTPPSNREASLALLLEEWEPQSGGRSFYIEMMRGNL